MKKEASRVTAMIPVAPTTLYLAWLDSVQHAAMTGSPAKIVNDVGTKFSAWNGYISGKLITLDLGRRIIMSWRTTDFPKDAHDSRVEIQFEALGGNTRVTILHTEIPEGQGEKYRAGWHQFYLTPMRAHFSKFLPDPHEPVPVRRPPPPPPDVGEMKPAAAAAKAKMKAAAAKAAAASAAKTAGVARVEAAPPTPAPSPPKAAPPKAAPPKAAPPKAAPPKAAPKEPAKGKPAAAKKAAKPAPKKATKKLPAKKTAPKKPAKQAPSKKPTKKLPAKKPAPKKKR